MGMTPSAARVASRWHCQGPRTNHTSSDSHLPRFSPTNEDLARQVIAKIDKIKAILKDATDQVWRLEGRVDKGHHNMEEARKQMGSSDNLLSAARERIESQAQVYHFDGT